MNIVFFAHPVFLGQQSMPRYAGMLAEGMKKRGHKVEIWSPKARFFKMGRINTLQKWLGYVDQYIIFPVEVRRKIKESPADTLFVFTDHALGPWVPLVADRPHVVHCHDFLAQFSALGHVPENITAWSGKKYQSYIRRGYIKANNFISVSEKTRKDLHTFLLSKPSHSHVVYNGLNQPFQIRDSDVARRSLQKKTGLELYNGYIFHLGGNQWYKNRVGVIEIYNAYRQAGVSELPLVMIGEQPGRDLEEAYQQSPYKRNIYLLSDIKDEVVRLAYCGASVFLFPSLAEGFGWPIAEAMASGCPVITTNEAPMTEVAGNAAYLIPKRPSNLALVRQWAEDAAQTVLKVLALSDMDRKTAIRAGLVNAKRFDVDIAINKIEEIYKNILGVKPEMKNKQYSGLPALQSKNLL